MQGALRVIHAGVRKHKLRQLKIKGDRNCQCHPVVKPTKLNLSLHQLRLEACNYLNQFPSVFKKFIESFPDYEEYLAHMRKDRSWGDQLTLTAIAHLVLRPITKNTDNEARQELHIDPQEFISPAARGTPNVFDSPWRISFEGTEPAVGQGPNAARSSIDVSSIPAQLLQSRFQHIGNEKEQEKANPKQRKREDSRT